MVQFTHDITPLEKGTRDKYHKYTFNNISYPSITTILSKTGDSSGLERWKSTETHHEYISEEARNIGTQTHTLIEDYLYNRPTSISTDLLSLAHFNRMLQFLNKIDSIRGLESYLYSKDLNIAGTADCIGMYNGNLSIIDYKTKRSDQKESYLIDYYLQATFYGIAWEEMTGQKINQIVILVSSRAGQLKEFIKNPDDYVTPLKERIKQYTNK